MSNHVCHRPRLFLENTLLGHQVYGRSLRPIAGDSNTDYRLSPGTPCRLTPPTVLNDRRPYNIIFMSTTCHHRFPSTRPNVRRQRVSIRLSLGHHASDNEVTALPCARIAISLSNFTASSIPPKNGLDRTPHPKTQTKGILWWPPSASSPRLSFDRDN